MIKWSLLGAGFMIAAWLIHPNHIGIKDARGAPNVSAVCEDATLSYSTSRSGTCSGHGGVKEWIE